jgi:uncharacterized protein YndB with AHSA1/START domain
MAAAKQGESTTASRTTMERASDLEIVIRRTFRAPAAIVFDAYTRPEHVRRWWAPASRGVRMVECEVDLTPGGAYRYVIGRGEDERYGFFGKFLEIAPPTRLVYTQTFEPFPDAEAVITVALEECDGSTLFVARERYPSREALEGALASGMEDGLRETFEQLDDLVVALRG